mmetsp:Transcript_25397/g.72492  ORF Transcript_25397/g.72492 Transcript_25397/m.72492 type:complete len:165 (+) Transcript_25397:69-563(+)
MGGSFSCSSARDAYGTSLEEGDWVECTSTGGIPEMMQPLGRVMYINGDKVTFTWTVWGTYIYDENDIRQYGLQRVMADSQGRKLKADQLVMTREGEEALIAEVGDGSATVKFSRADTQYSEGRSVCAGGYTQYFRQTDIDLFGVRVVSNAITRGSRKCTNPTCI